MLLMRLSKTVVCKLKPSQEDAQRLIATLEAFLDACNYISKTAFERRVFNPVALHHMVYRETRDKFKLPANLAIRARDRVAKAYKQRREINFLSSIGFLWIWMRGFSGLSTSMMESMLPFLHFRRELSPH
jgi:predicted transposase